MLSQVFSRSLNEPFSVSFPTPEDFGSPDKFLADSMEVFIVYMTPVRLSVLL